MLRSVTSKAVAGRARAAGRLFAGTASKHNSASTKRTFAAATSAQKRALNAQQLKGSEASSTAAPKAPSSSEPAALESGGSSIGPALALLVATGGVGAAYYNGLLDDFIGGGSETTPVAQKAEAVKKITKKKNAKEKAQEETTVAASLKEEISKTELDEVNELIADVIGEATMEVAAVTEAMDSIATVEKEAVVPATTADSDPLAVAKIVDESPPVVVATETTTPEPEPETSMVQALVESVSSSAAAPIFAASALDETKILAEIEQLKKKLHEKSDEALAEAHTELAKISSMDMMGLDMDALTNSQLKVRLVQMAKELEERTKWEAVRLQEFLAMKEKEVEDKYVLLIKKLRLEAELLQEEKLAEQRKILTAQAEQALSEQQTRAEAFLENSMQIQEQAHAEDKAAFEQKTEEAVSAKYEELFGQELTKLKEQFTAKMNQRVQQMEQLSKKLSDLETSLKDSQDFQVGSLEAHRITAAAIALMEKLEFGEPAGAAVNALKAVASENAVVSAAVQSLPDAVTQSGILTVQELQAGFEETIYPQCRRAANIPQGQTGLEGQLLGSFFATLRPAPGPDEAAPESEKDASEYVLSRIRRYVQLGELEKALLETKKLSGQVAFTAKDWESQAKDRVAVEKALKVIRMECALANENLGKAAAA